MTLSLTAVFLIPLLLSLLITPAVKRFAQRIGATDIPNSRKVHTVPMPRIGGMAIVASGVLSIAFTWILFPDLLQPALADGEKVLTVAICFLLLFSLGLRDDLKPLSPGTKFGLQFLLSSALYVSGFQISNISMSMDGGLLDVTMIDYTLTVLWIVGITNAFNLIDGLDGLATGVATIATASICIVSLISGQIIITVISLILAGSMLGFLRYNFFPATIFLGDSGSLVIGFAIALLSIESAANVTSGMAPLFPVLILMLPITDTVVSMARRLLGSFLDPSSAGIRVSLLRRLHRMFTPDKSHIHHKVLSMGFSHKGTVLLLYAVAGFCSISAFVFIQAVDFQQSLTLLILFSLLLGAGIKKLDYDEMSIFSNGLLKNWLERWIVHRSGIARMIDFSFALLAYGVSYGLLFSGSVHPAPELGSPLIAGGAAALQIGVFWGTGLYRERMAPFGIGCMIHTTASVLKATGLTILVLVLVPGITMSFVVAAQFFMVDFYVLMTLVLGYRVTHEALGYWFRRKKGTGEKVLIYGAGDSGVQTLNRLTGSSNEKYKVLGFLDDDPELEGEILFGYPVFGGHWELSKTYLNSTVESVIICDENIKKENLNRIRRVAEAHGISVKRVQVLVDDLPVVRPAHVLKRNDAITVNGEKLVSVFQSEHAHTQ